MHSIVAAGLQSSRKQPPATEPLESKVGLAIVMQTAHSVSGKGVLLTQQRLQSCHFPSLIS